jgi:hypothetical protein
MRQQARLLRNRQAERGSGIQSLFGDDDLPPAAPRGRDETLYVHTEPWDPFGAEH